MVGKLLFERKFNFKAIKSALLVPWKFVSTVELPPVKPGSFVCNFCSLEDLEAVIRLSSKNFRGSLILFCHWDPDCAFDELVFNTIDILVQVFNLPLRRINEANASQIEAFIETFISLDMGGEM